MQREAVPGAASRIIGGETVLAENAFPSYVQLRVRVSLGLGVSYSYFTCGGCIVHAWRRGGPSGARRAGFWVATAAHCLDPANVYEVNLWVGGVAAGQAVSQKTTFYGGQGSNAPGWRLLGPAGVRIYRHPAFDEDSLIPDVALLRVLMPAGEDLPPTLLDAATGSVAWSVVPVLGSSASYAGTPATILGFGKTSAGASGASTTLQRADAVVEPSGFDWVPSRQDRLYFHWVVGQSTLDSGTLSSTCSGDSGGPLLTRKSGLGVPPVLVGVLCCGWCREDVDMRRYPSLYTRMQPFLAAPSADYRFGLPEDSVWRKGILGIIAENSPVQLRTAVATEAGDEAVAGWSEDNEWIEVDAVRRGVTLEQLAVVGAVVLGAGLLGAAVYRALRGKGARGAKEKPAAS
jgi:hypothetical protein